MTWRAKDGVWRSLTAGVTDKAVAAPTAIQTERGLQVLAHQCGEGFAGHTKLIVLVISEPPINVFTGMRGEILMVRRL